MKKVIVTNGGWIQHFDTPRRRSLFRDLIELADEYQWELFAEGQKWQIQK